MSIERNSVLRGIWERRLGWSVATLDLLDRGNGHVSGLTTGGKRQSAG